MISSKGQYINGKWVIGEGTSFSSIDPAQNHLIWEGRAATKDEITTAAHAARAALPLWSAQSITQRIQIIEKFALLVEQRRADLSLLISKETGKPAWEAQTEVSAVIGKIKLSIQAYHERTGEKYTATPEAQACLRFKPHGVVVVLGAFNFPAHLSNGHIVPALVAGNTILYKPSELAPAVAEFIIQCWHDSGIPPGVLNGLQGGVPCGETLLAQDIQGVYFTGSYSTGLRIHQQFAHRPEVILALEMGGNNPLVISELQHVDAAVYHSILSTMITAGQRCTCARRLIIPDTASGDTFLYQFITACKRLRVGGFNQNPEPFMGPVIRYEHALNHLKRQKELLQSGGKSLLTMQLLTPNTGLLSPGIVDMSEVSTPEDREIFAPLVQVYRYQKFDEAIHLANQTHYGLAAGLISEKKAEYQQFYHEVRAGLINWNRPTTGAASSLPFGGVGHSGNHRPSAYFAADYCAYPVASMEQSQLVMPDKRLPGIHLE
ncbi:MAG: succinylglutamate-semialdehyde dehydrogenase [Legionella sp.]|nr:succinylglutamate-semialdehyde dehydrogenase [Legionella sp.]